MHHLRFEKLVEKTQVFAQISDSHLFAELDGLHHGHNVLANLNKVLTDISANATIKFIVFTGDLTQDHSERSYQRFVDCVQHCGVSIPIYYLAGNHDEATLLDKYFTLAPFKKCKSINLSAWQLQLLDSKSSSPAGYVSKKSLFSLSQTMDPNKYQIVMLHHNPIDVGYFIDKHSLKNQHDFWRTINHYPNIKAVACGHVHRAMQIPQPAKFLLAEKCNSGFNSKQHNTRTPITLYTCPATSIQFDPNVDGVSALKQGPGYRLFNLFDNGQLTSEVIYP